MSTTRRGFLRGLGLAAAAPCILAAAGMAKPETQYTMEHKETVLSPNWLSNSNQKFLRGQRVKLAEAFPYYMSHFSGQGGEAIVVGSYSDQYGRQGSARNDKEYTLLILKPDKYDPSPYQSSWYDEDLMTLVSDDREAGEALIQKFKR